MESQILLPPVDSEAILRAHERAQAAADVMPAAEIWSLVEEDVDAYVKLEPVAASAVTVPVTCRLRSFMDAVAVEMGHANSDKMLDWQSLAVLSLGEDSTDADVVREMRFGGFIVADVLFFIQNRACFSTVHLMRDILSSDEWRMRFFSVVRLMYTLVQHNDDTRAFIPNIPHTKWQIMAHHERLVSLRAYFHTPLPESDHASAVVPFHLPVAPLGPCDKGGFHATLRMVREATGIATVAPSQLSQALESLFRRDFNLKTKEEIEHATGELGSRLHSRLQLARLLAMDIRPPSRSQAATMYMLQDRAATLAWLQSFVKNGCACTS